MAGLFLGLIYLWLEYKANIWLWLVSIIMPIVHGYLYYARGIYADFAMEAYYVAIAVYGWAVWRFNDNPRSKNSRQRPITHTPKHIYPYILAAIVLLWAVGYFILTHFTDSKVPVIDSLTSAISMVAMWTLARKYVQQWLLWLVVDAISAALYVYKQIPFTAALYAFYTVIAVLGYRRWTKQAEVSQGKRCTPVHRDFMRRGRVGE